MPVRKYEFIDRWAYVLAAVLLMAMALPATLQATAVTVNFGVPGSAYNNENSGWFLEFTSSGDPALEIQQVTLTLGGDLVFDTGSLFSLPFAADPNGANVGTPGFTGTTPTPVPNNSTSFIISFNDFNPGETFRWAIDVDHAGALLGASVVNGSDFINNLTVAVMFGGPDHVDWTLSGPVSFTDSIDRGDGSAPSGDWGRATITGDIPLLIPEPGTMGLLGLGLLALGALRRRK